MSAALLTLVLSLVPLLASIWAHIVFGEPYGWLHVAGMALVMLAIEGARRAELAAEREAGRSELTVLAPAVQ